MSKNPYYNHDSKLQDLYPEGDGSFLGGGGGGGFEPTPTQMAAINSGATEDKINQIQTNANNINNKLTKLTDEGEFVYSHNGNVQTSKGFEVADDPSGSAAHVVSSKTVKAVKTGLDTAKLDKRTTGNEVYSHDGETQGALTVKTEMSSSASDSNILTEKGVKDYVDGKDPLSWNYVGILSASPGSNLTIKDDWTELLIVGRFSEGSSTYNIAQIFPKQAYTQGSPTGNVCMFGFYWNEAYNAKARIGINGTGDNRKIQVGYTDASGWTMNGYYIYKR